MTQQRVSPITVTSLLPATPVLSLQAALGQSANLTEWKNSSGTVLASISSAGLASLPNLTVTSTTVPANGVYLPAANTLGFATNSAVVMQIGLTGNFALGGSVNAAAVVRIGKNITGGTTAYGMINRSAIQSDVTTTARIFESAPDTAAATFTVDTITHFYTNGITAQGAGSTITTQTGFATGNLIQGATNNYGYYGGIPSGTGRWNIYILGTAANYFAGQTTVGSTSLTLGSASAAQQFGVVAGAATTVGAVIRGAASQTANLQEWQNSAGSVVSSIDSAGRAVMIALGVGGNPSGIAYTYLTTTSTVVALVVRGGASQSADLQQWQNSSATVLGKFDATGNIVVGNMAIATSSVATIHISNGTVPSANPTGGGVLYVEGGALKYRGSSGTITTIANA